MSIIIAPDSFKGSMSAEEFCTVVAELCREKAPHEPVITLPLADGGGVCRNAHYPGRDFWKIAGEEQCIAVVGSDAHRPEFTCVQKDYEGILDFERNSVSK